jgi:hypothetical protein
MASNPFADEPGYPRRSSSERANDWDRLFKEELDSESYQKYLDKESSAPNPIKPDEKTISFSTGIIGILVAVGLLIFLVSL